MNIPTSLIVTEIEVPAGADRTEWKGTLTFSVTKRGTLKATAENMKQPLLEEALAELVKLATEYYSKKRSLQRPIPVYHRDELIGHI